MLELNAIIYIKMNFETICRVCTSENAEMVSIFEFHTFSGYFFEIYKVITDCASIHIQKLDGFSECICKKCLENLYQAYGFRKLCQDSDYKFRNNLITSNKVVVKSEYNEDDTKIQFGKNVDSSTNIKSELLEEQNKDPLEYHKEESNVLVKLLNTDSHRSSKCDSSTPHILISESSSSLQETEYFVKNEQCEDEIHIEFVNDRSKKEYMDCETLSSLQEPVSNNDSNYGNCEQPDTLKPKRRKKKTDKRWKKDQVFPDKQSATESVKSEGFWSFHYKNVDRGGNVNEIYRCNKVKYRGEQCKAGISLNCSSYNNEVALYRSQLPHTCHEIPTKAKIRMDDVTKAEVKRLFDSEPKIKPRRIIEILNEKQIIVPKVTYVNNYLSQLRQAKFLATRNSFHDDIDKLYRFQSNSA